MTLESLKVKEVYQGNGATTIFPLPFAYTQEKDLVLLFIDAKGNAFPLTSNYKVTVNASGDASVTYPLVGDPLATGTALLVYRKTPRTQSVDLIEGGAFNPEVLEHDALDRIVMMIQEHQEAIDRSVKIPIASIETPDDLLEKIFATADQAEQASTQANIALTSANKSREFAQQAREAVDTASNIITSIEGFSLVAQSFYGICVDENMQGVAVKAEDKDTVNAQDFFHFAILPAEARFFLEGGKLALELPFTR